MRGDRHGDNSRNSRRLGLRYSLFVTGLFLMGLGIALTVRSDLGTSPISSVPYLLSMLLPLSFGQMTFLMALLYVAAQVLIYGKGFPRSQYFQIIVSPVFGFCIDFAMYVTRLLVPFSYLQQFLTLIAGCILTAVGIYLQLLPAIIVNPGEGIVRALTWKSRRPFGTVKILFDFSLMAIAVVLSLTFFQRIIGLREGSVISAFLVGWVTRSITSVSDKWRWPEKLGLRINSAPEPSNARHSEF